MKVKKYTTPKSLKDAIKSHRGKLSGYGQANQIRILFTRLLARLTNYFEERVVLKGGYALEHWTENARTTRDMDLSIEGSPDQILAELKEAGALDLGDFMRFELEKKKDFQTQYGGQTFNVKCVMDNETYGTFSIDICFGKAFGRIEVLETKNYLAFAGFPRSYIQLYPIETHIAEKLHAYSMERENNTRVKDFPDLAILASIRAIRLDILRGSFEHTFDIRGAHKLPILFPRPPLCWNETYEKMVQENELKWKNTEELFDALSIFLDPVLDLQSDDLTWDPFSWAWR